MAGEGRSLLRRTDDTGAPLFLIRLALGILFIGMGVVKIGDPVGFLKSIRLDEMLPETPPHFLNATAVVLPWLEVFCGTALVLGLWIRGAAACLVVMLCVFTPAILLRAITLHRTDGTPFFQIAFDCGCGSGPQIIWRKLLENAGLLVLAILALVARSRKFTLAWLMQEHGAAPAG